MGEHVRSRSGSQWPIPVERIIEIANDVGYNRPRATGDRPSFRITDAEREKMAKCLRYIDEARRALERQHDADNREIIRELRASADQIFELISGLEET